MQLYAIQGVRFVYIDDAKKGVSYTCTDCGEEVRVRRDRYGMAHFYHYKKRELCSASLKPASIHLEIQKKILSLLPEGEGKIEHPLPSIGRIADLLWEKRGLVFEVQCSPITLMEIKRRERAYRRIGIRVVWVLADNRFNKKKLSISEKTLRASGAFYAEVKKFYFTGVFYDQFQLYEGNYAVFKTAFSPVRLHCPLALQPKELPEPLMKRTLFFAGDLVDKALKLHSFRAYLFRVEKEYDLGVWKELNQSVREELRMMILYILGKIDSVPSQPEEVEKESEGENPLDPLFEREKVLEGRSFRMTRIYPRFPLYPVKLLHRLLRMLKTKEKRLFKPMSGRKPF